MEPHEKKPLLISVVGPTAVGKTSLAIRLAKEVGAEIISADSRQFYRELTIGTAKPSAEELSMVKHHFIDSHSIAELYSAGQFGRDAKDLIQARHLRGKALIAVGGSGLYFKALWEGFDEMPEVSSEIRNKLIRTFEEQGLELLLTELEKKDPHYYQTVDRHNHQRVIRALEVIRSSGKPFSSFRKSVTEDLPYHNLKIGLKMDREVLFDRINRRMDDMIEAGLFEEAAQLVPYQEHNALQTVGYSEIFGYLADQYDKDEAIRLLKRNSRRYAKRQLTWFNRYEDIHWFTPSQYDAILELIEDTRHG